MWKCWKMCCGIWTKKANGQTGQVGVTLIFSFQRPIEADFASRYAQLIWNEMKVEIPDMEDELSMEAVAMTVEWLYLSRYVDDCEGFALKSDDIKDAIRESDILLDS